MILYAESSAILRWLLGQAEAELVRARLQAAERVIASCLTIVECERALVRLTGSLPPAEASAARMLLVELASKWTLVEVDGPIRARAGQAFPVEPLRTLDALHLATVLAVVAELGPVEMLTCDERVIANANALGIPTASG